MKHPLTLVLLLVLVIGGGMAIGILTAPGDWYAGLNKPFFNPPNWIFAPVWTTLYVFIAVAGWLVWHSSPTLRTLWVGQLVLNFLWSPLFFAAQNPVLALVVILALLATIVWFIRAACGPHRLAALLFVPYAAWVAFASLLNASIVYLN